MSRYRPQPPQRRVRNTTSQKLRAQPYTDPQNLVTVPANPLKSASYDEGRTQRSTQLWTIIGAIAGCIVVIGAIVAGIFKIGVAWQSTQDRIATLQQHGYSVDTQLTNTNKNLTTMDTVLRHIDSEIAEIKDKINGSHPHKQLPDKKQKQHS